MHKSEKRKWSCSVESNPQRPHGLQPTRLLRPWDFPGKTIGVGCHCLLPYPSKRTGKNHKHILSLSLTRKISWEHFWFHPEMETNVLIELFGFWASCSIPGGYFGNLFATFHMKRLILNEEKYSRSHWVLMSLHACMPSHFSPIWLFVTLWTVAHQAPLSLGFSR